MKGFVFVFPIIFCFVLALSAHAEELPATARGFFIMLPASVFESTPEGLSDNEKQELLRTGKSEFWEISGETPDYMVFSNLPLHDRTVSLRLFHNDSDGSVEAAFGTQGDQVCTLELWNMDMAGRIVPTDVPPEPEVGEFFGANHKLSKTVRHSIQICLDKNGLVAVPIFWNKWGMLPARLPNEIRYVWTGQKFEKKVVPKIQVDADAGQ